MHIELEKRANASTLFTFLSPVIALVLTLICGAILFAALGYNGRGLAMATALGTLLARRALGEPREALPFPTSPLRSRPMAALAALATGARALYASLVRR